MKIFVKNKNDLKKIVLIVRNLILKKKTKIFLLTGELGSGKTTLIKKIAKYFKIKEKIISPTFILWQKYSFKIKNKNLFFNHLDLYRIKKIKEILNLDLKREIQNKTNIFFIEWGEKIEKYFKKKKIKYKKLILIKLDKNQRLIEIK